MDKTIFSRVLLHDDSPISELVLKKFFEELGASVFTQKSDDITDQVMAQNIDLAVIDIPLDDVRVTDTLLDLQNRLPDLPIILMSIDHEHLKKYTAFKSVHLLSKPVDPLLLQQIIENLSLRHKFEK